MFSKGIILGRKGSPGLMGLLCDSIVASFFQTITTLIHKWENEN